MLLIPAKLPMILLLYWIIISDITFHDERVRQVARWEMPAGSFTALSMVGWVLTCGASPLIPILLLKVFCLLKRWLARLTLPLHLLQRDWRWQQICYGPLPSSEGDSGPSWTGSGRLLITALDSRLTSSFILFLLY